MKIAFDSKQEYDDYIFSTCPDKVKYELEHYCYKRCDTTSCDKCWQECGIELEVPNETI